VGSNPDISQKYKMGDISKGETTHSSHSNPAKNMQKNNPSIVLKIGKFLSVLTPIKCY
jgi:hypothetical protein